MKNREARRPTAPGGRRDSCGGLLRARAHFYSKHGDVVSTESSFWRIASSIRVSLTSMTQLTSPRKTFLTPFKAEL